MKFFSNLRSQAALEFLTTYAWVLITVGVSLGTLYYIGFLDLSKYIPQECNFPSQFRCLDFSLNPTKIKVKLINNVGEDVNLTSITITNDATPPLSCIPNPEPSSSNPFQWNSSKEIDIEFDSCSGGDYISDERVQLKIVLSYYAVNTPSKPIHLINGKINGIITKS